MIAKNIYYKNKPLIWPVPNHFCWKEGYFLLRNAVSLSFDKYYKEETTAFVSQLEAENITVTVQESGGTVQLIKSDIGEINDEGYILEVTTENIVLKSNTCKGIFYGFQSLLQLITNSYGREIPCVYIIDSPFKPVRGVHIYIPPRWNIDWFKRYVDFLARYKFNTMFLEVGASMRYDSHPEINEAWVKFCKEIKELPGNQEDIVQNSVGHFKDSVHSENGGGSFWEKDELSGLLKYINERHIEIIPEMQSLSHSYWMLLSHMECAERDDDPYPDTYCPSNPKTYEIYFDCLQEVIDLFKPKMVNIGHDEYYTIGFCERCRGKTGHDILAGDIIKIHGWLAERGIKTALWGDKLFEYTSSNGIKNNGGVERLQFNRRTKKNELLRATYRAVDMVPNDITVIDWYHSLPGEVGEGAEDTKSQDYFNQRGMEVVFGNFSGNLWHSGFKNLEDRLRRPNVLGAECSHWREVSDLGMALNDQLVRYLDVANILWFEGYRYKMRDELNKIIAQVYPLERDKMNHTSSIALENKGFKYIDISEHYNIPLNWVEDYSLILNTGKLANTVPFKICNNVKDAQTNVACVLVGHEMNEKLEDIKVIDKYRALAFLHSYSVGNPVIHQGWDFNQEADIVGYYIIDYMDGTAEKIPVEYGRTITNVHNAFNAYRSNPVYQSLITKEDIVQCNTSRTVSIKAYPMVLFSYEWKNPYPEKEIKSIVVEHNRNKKGGILLFAVTGII